MDDQLPYNEVIAIQKTGENRFQSLHPPIALGGTSAYGGVLLALGLHAAYQTLSEGSKHKPYSVQGHYLGPTSIDEVVDLRVSTLRQTRTFETRHVILSQQVDSEDDDDKKVSRDCLSMVVDFIVTGDRNMITYSAPPCEKSVTHHSKLKNTVDALDERVKKGDVPSTVKEMWEFGWSPMIEIFEQKNAPESLLGQNMMGMLHKKKTTQDDRLVHEKVGYDWFRVRLPIKSSTSASALKLPPSSEAPIFLAFALDGALPYLALAFNHLFLMSAEVNTTSDFSLRFHLDEIDPNSWFLREMKTIAAGNERTYNEARVWILDENEESGYKMVATMTQACILRSKEGKTQKDRESKAKL